MVIDSLSKIEQIHFKKDVSGLELYKKFLISLVLPLIDDEIKNNPLSIKNKSYNIELNNLYSKIQKEIKHTTKRIEMIK